MTKEELQTRIAQINNEMIQTKANYAKLEGHLGESQHWLTAVIDAENAESQPEDSCANENNKSELNDEQSESKDDQVNNESESEAA